MDTRKLKVSDAVRDERRSILLYWKQRNKSTTYSKKLGRMFVEAFANIRQNPELGQLTNDGKRSKLVAGYRIIYTINPTEIVVVKIHDPRQGSSEFDS